MSKCHIVENLMPRLIFVCLLFVVTPLCVLVFVFGSGFMI